MIRITSIGVTEPSSRIDRRPAGGAYAGAGREDRDEMVTVRIVSEPLADYIRFEYESTPHNIAAGELVRSLPRRLGTGLLVPLNDYWVLDGRLVRFGYFAGNGDFLEDGLTDDPLS
jgi:hypothetical protein